MGQFSSGMPATIPSNTEETSESIYVTNCAVLRDVPQSQEHVVLDGMNEYFDRQNSSSDRSSGEQTKVNEQQQQCKCKSNKSRKSSLSRTLSKLSLSRRRKKKRKSDKCSECQGNNKPSNSKNKNKIPAVCVCSDYKETDDVPTGECSDCSAIKQPIIDLSKFNPDDFPIEDFDEQARVQRQREMVEGVDPPPGFTPNSPAVVVPAPVIDSPDNESLSSYTSSVVRPPGVSYQYPPYQSIDRDCPPPLTAHTQVDYIHCLVPDLLTITNSSFYWGKMDRYQAEKLLDNKPEGTFLLRDSAQEEYLFSVSFRRYGRSLHARIEQWNHRFSFDSHDPGVYASSTVCGLIEHYKDPSCCMFFEPMLTVPLHRNFTFSLQHLARAVVVQHVTYDGTNLLNLPKTLKYYLKEYHYKQRVRVRRLDEDLEL